MRPEAELDLECFHNWFLVGITDKSTGAEWDYQMMPGSPLDIASVSALLAHYTIVTFNGINYDLPMLMLALTGADNAMLKQANDDIIENGLKWWMFYKKYKCWPPDWIDHIDVSEVAPGVRVSLKQYMCRMSSPLVQDSPVDFTKPLPIEHIPEEIYYCRNDRRGTGQIRTLLDEHIKVRQRMSERYGVDLRSKSDAQMAEAMVKAEWARQMADSMERFANPDRLPDHYWHLEVPDIQVDYRGIPKPTIPHFPHNTAFKVKIPDHIEFATPYMQEFLQLVRDCDFIISNKDEAEFMGYDSTKIKTGVLIPRELKGRDIIIGDSKYRVGIGGLHSKESSVSYHSIPGVQTLMTADVASYYPSLIINAGMSPPQLGSLFLSIYKTFYRDRLAAKASLKKLVEGTPEYLEAKTIESGFKIVLNGTFGKLFSRHSIFYAPEFGIAVTIGGQLSLLMLIERMEMSGIKVISANTDGIEMLIPWGREWLAKSIIKWWEAKTRLILEDNTYMALYSRDVNNYISLQFDGKAKRKGAFAESGLLNKKHPDCDICAEAVVAFLTKGTPMETTINECRDIRKFIRVRGASGGAVWFRSGQDQISGDHKTGRTLVGGVRLGRAVRWYYAVGCEDYIIDGATLSKVAGSEGARPVMQLPVDLPSDINYRYYLTIAQGMLKDIGG